MNKKKVILIFIPILIFIFSMCIGRYVIPLGDIFKIIGGYIKGDENILSSVQSTVVFNVRLPRVLIAMIVGAALSASGAAYQGMFKNPMVSPDILGASQGAGFGVALGLLLSLDVFYIQVLSFSFGLLAVFLAYFISNRVDRNNTSTIVLVLAGMLISTLFSAFISLIKYVADPYSKLPAITFWLMGSIASVNKNDLYILIIPFVLGVIPLMLIRWKLNIMSLGEEEAKALGINTKLIRGIVITSSTLMTASCVSICGFVGWVGLVVPHLSRMIVGPNYKILLPTTMLIGASYLAMVDNLSRTLFSMEIPLGILTSIIGAPFFIYLLINARKGWV
ncbi:FecCD family ABC transporter permease [Clostridium hydrogeniformans]|uniref:FecCD family ABC transporter permease n=1 Tax=Clostridium hydrogeniformans TaxID=349933 RepID=UPI000A70E2ED|nr:iron ABC transporter permease [Clostridium hydrogeniformans]